MTSWRSINNVLQNFLNDTLKVMTVILLLIGSLTWGGFCALPLTRYQSAETAVEKRNPFVLNVIIFGNYPSNRQEDIIQQCHAAAINEIFDKFISLLQPALSMIIVTLISYCDV